MTNLTRSALLFLTSVLLPSQAAAHSFGAGTDQFASFVEGASVVIFDQVSLFATLSLGLMIALWKNRGVIQALPLFIAGLALGFLLAPSVTTWVIMGATVVGAITATIGASLNQQYKPLTLILALFTGLLVQMVSLEGHVWMELSSAIYVGVTLGAILPVMLGAATGELLLEKLPASFSRIAVRVACSWLAAIQIMMLAFFSR
ncbi:MAG: hypothetical protein ACPG4H_00900 [Marinobacterium sp.]